MEHANFTRMRRQKSSLVKLRWLEFAGQKSVGEQAAQGKSPRHFHKGSLGSLAEYYSLYA